MRWRPGPRSAFALGLLGACLAAMQLLRSEATQSGLEHASYMEWLKATVGVAAFARSQRTEGVGSSPAGAKSSTIDSILSHDRSGCAGARSTLWNPLAGVEYTGRVRIDLPARFGGAIVLFIGDTLPLDVEASTPRGDPVQMHQRRLRPGPGLHIPPDFWLDDDNPWSAPGHVIQATVDALHDRDLSFVVSLGRRAPRVLARLIGYPPDVRVPVCAVPVREGEMYFATGWYAEQPISAEDAEKSAKHAEKGSAENAETKRLTMAQPSPALTHGKERWMRDVGAVLVTSAGGGATTVRVRAASAETTPDDPVLLTLRVNAVLEMPPVPMREAVADYEWHVPDTAWVTGTNELLFSVSRTAARGTRIFGMGLRELTLLDRN